MRRIVRSCDPKKKRGHTEQPGKKRERTWTVSRKEGNPCAVATQKVKCICCQQREGSAERNSREGFRVSGPRTIGRGEANNPPPKMMALYHRGEINFFIEGGDFKGGKKRKKNPRRENEGGVGQIHASEGGGGIAKEEIGGIRTREKASWKAILRINERIREGTPNQKKEARHALSQQKKKKRDPCQVGERKDARVKKGKDHQEGDVRPTGDEKKNAEERRCARPNSGSADF